MKKKLISWEETRKKGFTTEELQKIEEYTRYKILMRKVKYARLQKKLTQETLASLSGVPRSTIAKVENGVQNVSLQKLQQIVSPMGLDLDIQLKEKTTLQKVV